ncbi:MAG TPA: carboxypeptidase regulatory-like domain-containing protein [Pyrinomonadaceae bacterium]
MQTTNRALKLARWLLPSAALFALACALFAPAEARRPAQIRERPPREPEARSDVRGRVLYDDTDRPVRRGRVILVAEGGGPGEYGALTNARGEFRVVGVLAGRYVAFVDVPGVLSPVSFISLSELRGGGGGGMPDLGEGRALFDYVEVDGKEDVTVTIRARRGATLSGRVTYADGDPAVNVNINLLRRDAAGRLQKYLTGIGIASVSALRTDDRGAFRVTGLPPGEYVVGVSEPAAHTAEGGRHRSDDVGGLLESLTGQQLLMTFHPSAASVKEAAVVKVAAGEERADVDVRIPERELRTVAGVVVSRREGRPLAGARVSIARRDDPLGAAASPLPYDSGESSLSGTTTDAEGRWQFTEIPDGPYTINVRPAEEYEPGSASTNMNSPAPADNRDLSAANRNGVDYRPPRRKRGHAPTRRDVEVAGDISDLTVEVGDGARVAGSVAAEGGATVEYARVNLVRVPAAAEAGPAAPPDLHSAQLEGGRFSFDGLPAGRYFVQPSTYNEEPALYVKSVTWNGRDLMREPLELAEGATAEGVRIVYARNPASLRVKAVRAGDRKPALNALVFLMPADPAEWSPYSAQLSCWTANEGSCTLSAPPGDYRVVALSRRPAREGIEAEVRRRAAASPLVSLRAGETKEWEMVVPEK